MKKFAGIELCRFLCALAVVVFHYQHFFVAGLWSTAYVSARTALPLYGALAPFYQQGDMAVRLFWTISGFIFFWKYASSIHNGAVGGGQFFVWRLARLYPLHILTLLIVAVLQALYLRGHVENFIYASNNLADFQTQVMMSSNWFTAQEKTFNGPIWSVSVEVLVYALFFLLVRTFRPGLVFAFVAAVASLGLFASRVGHYMGGATMCATLFFGGGFVYQVIARLSPAARRPIFWVATATSIAAAFAAFHHDLADEHPSRLLLILFALATVAAFALIEDALPFDLTRAARFSDLTYASYLWHFPLQIVFVLTVDGLGLSRELFLSPVMLAGWVGATFIVADFSRRYFELPAQNALRAAYLTRIAKAAPEGANR